ncbi:MAG: aromatic ring-hydroxylating dioxygenase subunit alpha, partial [Rubrivivax sp.]|nr:aromatic ring-hydroxylating dioxygenase subunit alpha [Rubrivivax sp.]
MSDLSISLEALERSRSQLSVTSYFDEDLFRREQALIFAQTPRYIGHGLAVPAVGDYQTLAHEGEGRALIRAAGGVQLVSN